MLKGFNLAVVAVLMTVATARAQATQPISLDIRTPAPPATPRINGPHIYGERPGRPFLYTIPATGFPPMTFAAKGLPDGLKLDAANGRISGTVATTGDYTVTLTATNPQGTDTQLLLIRIGDQICLTPPMGWNSWNCFGGSIDQDKMEAQAAAMVSTGLIEHGWTYVNIDDTWQGVRSGPDHALQPNEKFPDMKKLCDDIHALGLKAGIYSTPWVTSYARHAGGSAMNPEGNWAPPLPGPKTVNKKILPWAVGKYHFMKQDAKQWADWGFDYLKYDWNPIETPDVAEMGDALNVSGRDFVYSLSNSAPFSGAADWARLSNLWRTSSDIRDRWQTVLRNGDSVQKWAQFEAPGHWNDPDMLVVGMVGWGPTLHPSHLTSDEQYTHITWWCLLSAPLLLGCDMTHMDGFTYGLLSNDEVLAVDQDALGKQATRISQDGGHQVWAKQLSDGTWAVGLFNRGEQDADVTVQLSDLKLESSQPVRDLWRQKPMADADGSFTMHVAAHGAELVKIGAPVAVR